MKNKNNKLKFRFHTCVKILLAVTIFSSGLICSSNFIPGAHADTETWGPQDRATFTWQEPADYVTFNSIIDNPLVGDERNFVRIRKADSTDMAGDNINLEVGQQYEVLVWFHNNAKSRLNKEENAPGVARDVRLQIDMPEVVKSGYNAEIKGTISANNANPLKVWDDAFAYTDSDILLRYVPNSATIHLNEPGDYDASKNGYYYNGHKTTEGEILNSDALFGIDGYGGAKLAYFEEQWGTLPGCSEYSGYVTFKIAVDQPDFAISKTVRKEGEENYVEKINAKPGDVLEFKLEYNNTGTTIQHDVVIKDTLPAGLSYVEDSTYFDSSLQEGKYIPGDQFSVGVNIGDFAAGDNAYLTYKARVDDNTDAFPCGDTVVYNDGVFYTANGTGHDKAEITVSRTCDCATNPDMEGCQELPNTGPVEIAIATLIIGGIGGAGYYFIATKRNLKHVESSVNGPMKPHSGNNHAETPRHSHDLHRKPHSPKN